MAENQERLGDDFVSEIHGDIIRSFTKYLSQAAMSSGLCVISPRGPRLDEFRD